MTPDPHPSSRRGLLPQIVCPHCWTIFRPEETLWIAESSDLGKDRKLGEFERVRFLPTQFDERCFAIDPGGLPCKDVACPRCHLRLPPSALEAPAIFFSIAGAPASGKSYYISSSTFALRSIMPRDFLISYADADPVMNRRVREYESLQFFSGEQLRHIEKTDEHGDLYNVVKIGNEEVTLPQPFVFTAQPLPEHPNGDRPETVARTVCLYDNSGESYLPSAKADRASAPVTRHLAQSSAIFFIFDPLQDPRFRKECAAFSSDPQLREDWVVSSNRYSSQSQESVLSELIRRVRGLLRLGANERYKKPFIVIVSKYDVWKPLLNFPEPELVSKLAYKGKEYNFLMTKRLFELSSATRAMLTGKTPEFVAVTESFAQDVVYIPVSAAGTSPTIDEQTNMAGFRSVDLKPRWCEIPTLYALTKVAPGLVPASHN